MRSKIRTRIGSLLLSIIMLLSLLPVTALADGETGLPGNTQESGEVEEQDINLSDLSAAHNIATATDLQNTISNAEDGQEIELILEADINVENIGNSTVDQYAGISIPENKVIVLDLNGYKINAKNDGYAIGNHGALTINDSSLGKTGIICHTGTVVASNYGHDTIRNFGSLTINGGTFGDCDMNQANANTDNRGASVRNQSGATCTINNGFFTCGDNYWQWGNGTGFSYAIRNMGTMTINDATLYGAMNGGIASEEFGTLTINGGSFSVTGPKSYYVLVTGGLGEIKINGGTFTKVGGNGGLLGGFSGMPSWDATAALEENGYAVNGGTFIEDGESVSLVPKAQIADKTYETLESAISAAQDGDTIELLSDITLSTPVTIDGKNEYALLINKSITIDGSSADGSLHVITVSTNRGIGIQGTENDPADVAFHNIKIVQTKGRSCIETRSNIGTLTLENTTLDTSSVTSGNPQALTIGGNQSSKAAVVISNSTITASSDGYCVITFNPVDMKITGSTLAGWASLYFKAPDSSAGSAGSSVTVTGNSILDSKNEAGSGDGWNQFGAINFEDNNITVIIQDATLLVSSQSPNEKQNAIFFKHYCGNTDTQVSGNKVFIENNANITISGDQGNITTEVGENEISITGGKFNIDPSVYVASGYIVKRDGTSAYTYTVLVKSNLTSGIYMSDPTGATASNYYVTKNNDGTWTVYYSAPSGGGSSSGGSSSSGTTTETEKNPDGSTTTTVTKPDGTVTETTKNPDGSSEVIETKKDGTVTTTTTDKAGNKTEVVEKLDGSSKTTVDNKDGSSSTTTVSRDGQVEAEVKLPTAVIADAADKGEAVTLPMPEVPVTSDKSSAPTVTVDLSSSTSAKVEIPVENVTTGTVAVLVKADGTEEVIKTTLTTESGVAITLSDGDTVKIVDNSKKFDDVSDHYWGNQYIDFATSRELFSGTSESTFSPEAVMTRGMIVTVLASYDGADTSAAVGETWYAAGQQWAVENGVSDGTDMSGSLNREQLAVMLWSYAGKPTPIGDLSSFADADSTSDWAVDALAWAVENGLISGMDDGTLNPQGNATRAQVATIMTQFVALTA